MSLVKNVDNHSEIESSWSYAPLGTSMPIADQIWAEETVPLVSICCIAYNHERFIRDALDGFLKQKTTFPVEILIHDDASTDRTAAIIREYTSKCPLLFKPIYQTENQYSKGGRINTRFNFSRARGKYIAICEGDDFWTDPLKLQKQVSFLEENPDFATCFHNVNEFNEDYPERNRLHNSPKMAAVTSLDDLLAGTNYIATASTVTRTHLVQKLPSWASALPFGDYALHIIAARQGKIRYIDEVMGTYRIHQGGVHGHLKNSPKGLTKAYQQHYAFWKVIRNSGIVNCQKLTPATLRAITNIVDSAAQSQQLGVFLKYNYLWLLHSQGRSSRQVVKGLMQFARTSLRKMRDRVIKKFAT
jgi:glycosyltransferase involved in cell wall biosynthesis